MYVSPLKMCIECYTIRLTTYSLNHSPKLRHGTKTDKGHTTRRRFSLSVAWKNSCFGVKSPKLLWRALCFMENEYKQQEEGLSWMELNRVKDRLRAEKKKKPEMTSEEESYLYFLFLVEQNAENKIMIDSRSYSIWFKNHQRDTKEGLIREIMRLDDRIKELKGQRNYIIFFAVLTLIYVIGVLIS